jgi:23S rRNA (guanosine2251-2'-O)-methyltransferase
MNKEKDNMLFGIRPIIEALTSGKNLDKIFLQKGSNGPIISELRNICKETMTPVSFVPVEKLNRLTRKNHQGAVAFGSVITYYTIDQILPTIYEQGRVPLILILDKITDVRNFGAIARTAECTGVDAIIIPAVGAAAINGDALKTSAGALHKIKVCREHNLKYVIDYLKESGLQIISCTEKGNKNYTAVSYTKPTAIIMGSEESGVSAEYLKRSDEQVTLPLLGEIASLNVGVATGVILYEVVSQRVIS